MENTEKPITTVVKHSRTVFQNTFFFFSVTKRPQKHRASRTTMNTAAPVLNGRPSTFTKNRSVYAASFGRYGIMPKSTNASITHEMRNIFTYSQKW